MTNEQIQLLALLAKKIKDTELDQNTRLELLSIISEILK